MANINAFVPTGTPEPGFHADRIVGFIDLSEIKEPAANDTITFFQWRGGVVLGAEFEVVTPGANSTMTLQWKLGNASATNVSNPGFSIAAQAPAGTKEVWYPQLPVRAASGTTNQLIFRFSGAVRKPFLLRYVVDCR